MITEKTLQKYASIVLLNTVKDLFDNKEDLIKNFYKDLAQKNKKNKKLKDSYKDNEVIDELILGELEKSFTQNNIGLTLQKQMVTENDKAIDELSEILTEKLRPIAGNLKPLFKDDAEYNLFKKYTTECLVTTNLDLNTSVIKALKTLNIEGIKAAQIIQLTSQIA